MCIENFVIAVLISLIQAFVGALIIFSQIKVNNLKKKLIYILLMFIYGIFIFYIIPNQIRFIMFTIVVTFILKFVLKINDKRVILSAFNTQILLAISEILVTLVMVILGINSLDIVENIFYNFIANIFISLTTIILISLPFIRKLLDKINSLFVNNRKLMNYFYIFIITLYFLTLKNGLELIFKSNFYINILFILSMVLILSIIIRNELKSEQLQEQNKQMLNYVSKYEKIITEQGKANHEFKNQLMVIKGYAQMDQDKLLEYIDSIIKDVNKTKSSYMISQLNKFPDGGIKGLLYYKFSIIEEEKINYNFNVGIGVKSKLSSLSVNKYKNITKILGVLLDNAIDASKKSNDKNILVSVTSENNKVIFSIYNTFKGKVDVSKLGSGYTTKGKKHGYGLKLVNDVISTNNDLKIESYLENKYFVTNLIVNVKNKKKK